MAKQNNNKKFDLDEVIKIPPLTNLFDAGIQEEIDNNELKRQEIGMERFPLSPSQLGGCSRKMALDLAEFSNIAVYPKEKYDPRSTRRFSRGYDIEYSLLKQLNKYVPIQQSYKQQHIEMARTFDDRIIGGSVDVVLVDENEAMITDIKSKATYYSNAYTDKFEHDFKELAEYEGVHQFGDMAFYIEDIHEFYHKFPIDNFTSRYFIQLNMYGASPWAREFRHNGFPNIKGISHVSLLFENKNNHMLAEVRWKPSIKLYDETIEKAQNIYNYVVRDKKEPSEYPAEFTLGTVNCRLCDRRAVCWKDKRHPWNGPKTKWAKDIDRLEGAENIEKVYENYKKLLTTQKELDRVEQDLLALLVQTGEQKVRFSDTHIYEIKKLKSPKEHLKLKRSK